MGRPTGGSGGISGSAIFTTNLTNSGSVGTSLYINLGTIPAGKKIWFGNLQATSTDKSVTFEVRTSNAANSTGSDSTTTVKASISASVKGGTVVLDMHKNNTLHTVSVVGTGVECFWIKLRSNSSALGGYLYSLNYTLE